MGIKKKNIGELECKLYMRRWLMLGLFISYTFNSALQWTQFTIIGNLVTKYYNISATQVEWTSNVFTLSYIILVIPYMYMINKLGVRWAMIGGAAGIMLGNWIKVFSVAPDRFYLVMVGQTCSALLMMMTFGLVCRFTALWFGADEIATAGALTSVGDQIGTAFAFILPSIFVHEGSSEVIGDGLRTMHITFATISTVVFLLVLFLFKSRPKLPPSLSQAKQRQMRKDGILKTIGILLKKRSFILFVISYGVNGALYMGLSTLLNELILTNFPGRVQDAGRIGSLMMVTGLISSCLMGKILDKTRKYKECAVGFTLGGTASMIVFTWALKSNNILYVYISAFLLGFFIIGYLSNGLQLGLEITYPTPEHISTFILYFICQIFVFVTIIIYSKSVKAYGDVASNIGLIILSIIGTVTVAVIPSNLKRQRAENETNKAELTEFLRV